MAKDKYHQVVRTALEKELKETGSQQFDVLAIDAFTGDMIPTHLLTKEAIELYLKHLKDDGILVFNITNKYLNIFSVLEGQSKTLNMPLYFFQQAPDQSGLTLAYWALFTKNEKFINKEKVKKSIVSFNSQGGTATITGCTFDNNHTGVVGANTGGDGGAISVTGGGSGGTRRVTQDELRRAVHHPFQPAQHQRESRKIPVHFRAARSGERSARRNPASSPRRISVRNRPPATAGNSRTAARRWSG